MKLHQMTLPPVGVMMDGVRFNDFISNEITSNDARPFDSITIDLVPKLQM